MSLYENKWWKQIKILNGINGINENKLNIIAGFNLLHDILNSSKHTKNINSHYPPILYGCMNTQKGRAN